MRIVVDTNRIIASLIRDSYSRSLIYNNKFVFYTPAYAQEEINKYKGEIMEKSGLNGVEFDALFFALFEKIKVMALKTYDSFMVRSSKLISDVKDVPFIALCLALSADGIWSDDKDFVNQKDIRVFTTKELLQI